MSITSDENKVISIIIAKAVMAYPDHPTKKILEIISPEIDKVIGIFWPSNEIERLIDSKRNQYADIFESYGMGKPYPKLVL